MERSEPTAEASFAATRACSRLGIAIAATITTGMMTRPRYPSTRPGLAMPRPPIRPAELRISESEMWPRIIAAMEAGRKNVKIPQTRLAMALPLVGASPVTGAGVANEPPGTGVGPGVVRAAAEESGCPHFEQNCPESGLAVPQFRQNIACLRFCLRGNISFSLTNARILYDRRGARGREDRKAKRDPSLCSG